MQPNVPIARRPAARRGDRIEPYKSAHVVLLRCVSPLLAQSGHVHCVGRCPLSGAKRTWLRGAAHLEVLPDVPTVDEFVPGYEASSWFGVGAPKDTSTEIIEKLNKEIDAIVAEPNMKARLVGLGLQPMSLTSAEFGKFISDQIEKWAKVIRAANIKPE